MVVRTAVGAVQEVGAQVVVELRREVFLLHEAVLQGEDVVLHLCGIGCGGIGFKELLVFGHSLVCGRLVQTYLGHTLVERFPCVETCLFGKFAARVGLIVFLEILLGRVVVARAVVRHSQEVERFLAVFRALERGNHFAQHKGGGVVFAYGEHLLRALIFDHIVARFRYLVVFAARRKSQKQ